MLAFPTVHVVRTFAKILLLYCFLDEGIDLVFCDGCLTLTKDEGRGRALRGGHGEGKVGLVMPGMTKCHMK